MYDISDIKRFWDKVQVGTNSECWEWQASTTVGYGQFRLNGKILRSHRLSWSMANSQEIPEDLLVMHSCDNRRCQNPNHLSLGTHQDNVDDMVAKGRSAKGSRNAYRKLTEQQVREIRLAYKNPTPGLNRQLQKKYGVHEHTIYKIATNRSWKHVKV